MPCDPFLFADDLGPAKTVHLHEPASGLRAIVVVDNVVLGPAIGGVRMAADADLEECFRLARAMTLKAAAAGLPQVAPYAVAMAYRVRFYVEMNAREAMHLIELRSAPQGHPSYRRIAQTMHRLIAERAGHRAIAAAMSFADHSDVELERLEAERAAERRRG